MTGVEVVVMEKRTMNSFGTVTIPKSFRDELGITGMSQVYIGVRDSIYGGKEIIIRKKDNLESVLAKYRSWTEVISRILECSVALVWNSQVLSFSSADVTDDFIAKNLGVSDALNTCFRDSEYHSAILSRDVDFFTEHGKVSAFFRINNTDDDIGFFVVVRGTKYDVNVSKSEEKRRYLLVKDIVGKINV